MNSLRELSHRADGRGAWILRLIAAAAAAVLVTAATGMLRGTEPWATWFYPLAWYPTLVLAELWLIRRRGRGLLASDPLTALASFAWSVPFWLLFELVNFRVANWYYVFVPHHPVERWTGIILSFATVFPALFVAREVARELGVGVEVRWRELRVSPRLPAALQFAGVAFVVVSLGWPLYFYPLVWGALTLLLDPWVYQRRPARSLLGALESGRPALILQLLAGGLAIGFLWELFNVAARGKWIYTVPGLEQLKLFEMPLLGFLGFPVLALDAWAAWRALQIAGLAPDESAQNEIADAGRDTRRVFRVGVVAVLAAVCSAGVLRGMERWTITSTTPLLEELVGDAAPALASAGHDGFSLARSEPSQLASTFGIPAEAAREWVERAAIVVLRGIGVDNAERLAEAGIQTVDDLAGADAGELAERLGAADYSDRARIRLWVRAARESVEAETRPPR